MFYTFVCRLITSSHPVEEPSRPGAMRSLRFVLPTRRRSCFSERTGVRVHVPSAATRAQRPLLTQQLITHPRAWPFKMNTEPLKQRARTEEFMFCFMVAQRFSDAFLMSMGRTLHLLREPSRSHNAPNFRTASIKRNDKIDVFSRLCEGKYFCPF